jgi:Flp pilus assembly protein CpaB
MKRRRGVLWLLAGLALALLAAGLSYFAFQQMVVERASALEKPSTQAVVVAKQTINERAVIRPGDISTEERPIADIPSGAIFKTDDAVGRIAVRSIPSGQVLLAQQLIESFAGSPGIEASDVPTDTVNFSEALGDELVAFALPVGDKLSREGILLAGDRVDLLFSTDVVGQQEGTGGKVSIYAIQDLVVLQIIYQPQPEEKKEEESEAEKEASQSAQPALVPKTLILAIQPQDSVVLKYALDSQSPIDLVLRARDNRRFFDVDSVHINTISERYRFNAPRPLP